MDFLFEVYRNPVFFKELERKFAKVRRGKTPKRVWICDMALWGAWSLRTNRKIGILNDFSPVGVWFDGKINGASTLISGVEISSRDVVSRRRDLAELDDVNHGPIIIYGAQ